MASVRALRREIRYTGRMVLGRGGRVRFGMGLGAPSIAGALLIGACGNSEASGTPPATGGASSLATGGTTSTGGSSGGTFSTGGSSLIFGTGGALDTPCRSPDAGAPVFAAQAAAVVTSGARELFSWTTDTQIAELRRDRILLTREERAGLGPGFAIDSLVQRATDLPDEAPVLNRVLELFKKLRYAWTNPWATRMGWEGETYGNQLIRIRLREDAWVMSINAGVQGVTDLAGQAIPVEAVRATPERIGALFFTRSASSGGPSCGSFTSGSNGYREFIVGNEAMVEEWSIGTVELHDRLTSDVALLTRFFDRIRACPVGSDPMEWNRNVVCSWGGVPTTGDEATFYEAALAMPSAAYLPSPANISTLIDTLSADASVMGAPLIVRPGE